MKKKKGVEEEEEEEEKKRRESISSTLNARTVLAVNPPSELETLNLNLLSIKQLTLSHLQGYI